jgi:hypothetical protein
MVLASVALLGAGQDTSALATGLHPLSGTTAQWLWALPLLPLLGFVLNGALAIIGAVRMGPADPSAPTSDGGPAADHGAAQGADAVTAQGRGALDADHSPAGRHRFAGLVSVIGPLVLIAAFALACAICADMIEIGRAHV